jgi:hypothetical protein
MDQTTTAIPIDADAGAVDTPASIAAGFDVQSPAAETAALHKPGWPDRIDAGNALLSELFPELVLKTTLPTDLDYNRSSLLVAPWPGATKVLITFGGNTGYLMLPPPIVTMQDTHLIAIRDPQRCFALCGIPGLGETYAECVGNLRQLIDALDRPDVYLTGVSAGGYPALRYGLDLGAHGVLGFSAPTTLDLADDPGADLSRYPQLTALYRQQPDIPLDLARLYAATSPRPRAMLLFSMSNDRDTWLVDRMRQIEGIEAEPVANEAGHRVFVWLNAANAIPSYFDRLFALRRLEAPPTEKSRGHTAPGLAA